MKTTILFLRLRNMVVASKNLGISEHPAIVKIELELEKDYYKSCIAEKFSDVN